jgi:hypothetical protein
MPIISCKKISSMSHDKKMDEHHDIQQTDTSARVARLTGYDLAGRKVVEWCTWNVAARVNGGGGYCGF